MAMDPLKRQAPSPRPHAPSTKGRPGMAHAPAYHKRGIIPRVGGRAAKTDTALRCADNADRHERAI